jgi:hypothetical protein
LSIEHARESVVDTPAPIEAGCVTIDVTDATGAGGASHPMLAFISLDPAALLWPSSTTAEDVR